MCGTYVSELDYSDIYAPASQSLQLPNEPCWNSSSKNDLASPVVQISTNLYNHESLDQYT